MESCFGGEETHLDQLVEDRAENPEWFGLGRFRVGRYRRQRPKGEAEQPGLRDGVFDVCAADRGESATSAQRRFVLLDLVQPVIHRLQKLSHHLRGNHGDELIPICEMSVSGIVGHPDTPRQAADPQACGTFVAHGVERFIDQRLPQVTVVVGLFRHVFIVERRGPMLTVSSCWGMLLVDTVNKEH